jgi:hypothetical protein
MFILFILMIKTIPRDFENLRRHTEIDYKFLSGSESSSVPIIGCGISKIEINFKKRTQLHANYDFLINVKYSYPKKKPGMFEIPLFSSFKKESKMKLAKSKT